MLISNLNDLALLLRISTDVENLPHFLQFTQNALIEYFDRALGQGQFSLSIGRSTTLRLCAAAHFGQNWPAVSRIWPLIGNILSDCLMGAGDWFTRPQRRNLFISLRLYIKSDSLPNWDHSHYNCIQINNLYNHYKPHRPKKSLIWHGTCNCRGMSPFKFKTLCGE